MYSDQMDFSNKRKYIKVTVRIIVLVVFLLGIIVCGICNYAISNTFTWSLYPICSIVLAWIILFPYLYFDKKQVVISLALLSVFIIPYLCVLYKILGGPDLFIEIGIRASVISIIYLWTVYLLFIKLDKSLVISVSLLLSIPVSIYINIIVRKYVASPSINIYQGSIYGAMIVISVLILYYRNKKSKSSKFQHGG